MAGPCVQDWRQFWIEPLGHQAAMITHNITYMPNKVISLALAMALAVKIRQGFLKGPTLSETFRNISARKFIHLPERGSQQKSDSNKTRFFLSSDAT